VISQKQIKNLIIDTVTRMGTIGQRGSELAYCEETKKLYRYSSAVSAANMSKAADVTNTSYLKAKNFSDVLFFEEYSIWIDVNIIAPADHPFRGDHDPLETYAAADVVMVGLKLYKANSAITNLPFQEGVLANEWSPITAAIKYHGVYDVISKYAQYDMVYYENALYISNGARAAGPAGYPAAPNIGIGIGTYTKLNIGTLAEFTTTGNYEIDEVVKYEEKIYEAIVLVAAGSPFNITEWRLIGEENMYLGDFANFDVYKVGNVVYDLDCLWRCTIPHGVQGVHSAMDYSKWMKVAEVCKFKGIWLLTNEYEADDVVINPLDNNLYLANTIMPVNTPFQIGTGATMWTELSRAKFRGVYAATEAYFINDVVMNGNVLYKANSDIAALQPWNVGTLGNEWTELAVDNLLDFDIDLDYKIGDMILRGGQVMAANNAIIHGAVFNTATWDIVGEKNIYLGDYADNDVFLVSDVVYEAAGGIWRCTSAHGVLGSHIAMDPTKWELIAGVSSFRGPWTNLDTYKIFDVVIESNKLYKANTAIAPGLGFTEGVLANEWTEISANDPIPLKHCFFDITKEKVTSYLGNLFDLTYVGADYLVTNGGVTLGIDINEYNASDIEFYVNGVLLNKSKFTYVTLNQFVYSASAIPLEIGDILEIVQTV